MRKTCRCRKRHKPVESTPDFKARLAAMLDDGSQPVRKVSRTIVRPKGSQPTPAEVLGGKHLLELEKPSRAVAKWLRSLGIKV